MNRDYWDSVGDSYDDEIFSVLHHDRDDLIRTRIERHGRTGADAADLGCGVGHFLPLLAGNFSSVFACDLSEPLLEQARSRHGNLKGITFGRMDLSRRIPACPPVDFALCINVLITSRPATRDRTLRNLPRCLKPGGVILLVVPSLESALLTSARMVQWNRTSGQTAVEAEKSGLPRRGSVRQIHRGNIAIDGVLTKHYLKEELAFLLPDAGLTIEEIRKINYPWSSEFAEPPDWMQAPHPWDWLVMARKPG